MMAQSATPSPANTSDRKRVKVYELKNNDWYDRGTGFCTGQMINPAPSSPENFDARIVVVSEDEPGRTLLETRITKDDGYQKQQETLVVWTEPNGVDMALSFQEAEGCASIWEFVSDVQGRLAALAPDDGLSDDLLDPVHPVILPEPALGARLDDVEMAIRAAASNPATRDSLGKLIMNADNNYIMKLAPLVSMAEDLESLSDLHKLCTITKHLILLNDTAVIEFAVTDEAIMGVVGALEYDPDFPSHRANHRQYLSDSSKFKQVVPIEEPEIRRKIHWTYRLLYLKDVVLARILDDPTFSVLNSLIFFHQVDIVNHLQSNEKFLKDLFDIFGDDQQDATRRKEAVLFIQNCCAVSKNIQAQSRAQLYQNFISHGLFNVITYALRHNDAAVRVAGSDVLVALIDHDPHMVRNHIYTALRERQVPLTDTLIELLLVEVDLGVKTQMADSIKVLLDPVTGATGLEMMNRANNAELMAKHRGTTGPGATAMHHHINHHNPHTIQFVENFYESSAKRLFAPLIQLETRPSMSDLTVQETSLYTHLVEALCFFVRQHTHRSKPFIIEQHLHIRVSQLLGCPQKHMKLTALKWFRTCVGLQDEFHNRQMIMHGLFEPILSTVEETMPRDNLLNSACLELFEYIKRETVKQLIVHLVETYRERLLAITYVSTFHALVLRYDQLQAGYPVGTGAEEGSFTTQEGTPLRVVNGRHPFQGLKDMDHDEEAYFNTDDDVEDEDEGLPTNIKQVMVNGASPVRPLVNYPDDEDEGMDLLEPGQNSLRDKEPSSSSSDDRRTLTDAVSGDAASAMEEDATSPLTPTEMERGRNRTPVVISPGSQHDSPIAKVAKRRREDEDEDELGKMMAGVKRRPSSTSLGSRANLENLDGAVSRAASSNENSSHPAASTAPQQQQNAAYGQGNMHTLRRKGNFKIKNESSTGASRFTIKPINLSAVKSQADHQQQKREHGSETHEIKESKDVQDVSGEGGEDKG